MVWGWDRAWELCGAPCKGLCEDLGGDSVKGWARVVDTQEFSTGVSRPHGAQLAPARLHPDLSQPWFLPAAATPPRPGPRRPGAGVSPPPAGGFGECPAGAGGGGGVPCPAPGAADVQQKPVLDSSARSTAPPVPPPGPVSPPAPTGVTSTRYR